MKLTPIHRGRNKVQSAPALQDKENLPCDSSVNICTTYVTENHIFFMYFIYIFYQYIYYNTYTKNV